MPMATPANPDPVYAPPAYAIDPQLGRVQGPGDDRFPPAPPPQRVAGPGDAHDWPWNRQGPGTSEPIRVSEPAVVSPPAAQAAPAPAPAAAEPATAEASPPPPPPEDDPNRPKKRGWWNRLTG
jgi:ribonuclease E